jgi:hypothetical protein
LRHKASDGILPETGQFRLKMCRDEGRDGVTTSLGELRWPFAPDRGSLSERNLSLPRTNAKRNAVFMTGTHYRVAAGALEMTSLETSLFVMSLLTVGITWIRSGLGLAVRVRTMARR